MSYKPVTGVSPRYAICLQISDTLLCLGLEPVRSKINEVRVIKARGVTVKVHLSYMIDVSIDGLKLFKTRSIVEAQKHIMRYYP